MIEMKNLYHGDKKLLYETLLNLLEKRNQVEYPAGTVENQILEMIAYEQDNLDNSFNEITRMHLLQYFKLLGEQVKPSMEEIILGQLNSEINASYYAGDSFEFQNLHYELMDDICIMPIPEKSFLRTNTLLMPLSVFFKGGNSYFEFPDMDGSDILFVFSKKLKPQKKYQMYFEFEPTERVENFNFDSKWQWEYFSEFGWCPLQIENDSTFGLSQSGLFCFSFFKNMTRYNFENERYYCIRAKIIQNRYQTMPRLKGIIYNAIALHQNITLACFHSFYTDSLLKRKVHQQEDVYLLLKVRDEYIACVDYEGIQKRHQNALLVYQSKKITDFLNEFILKGIPDEIVMWNEKYKIKSFKILIYTEERYYACPIYELDEVIETNTYGCFVDYENHCLRFGNGRNFLIPKENSYIFVYDLTIHETGIVHQKNSIDILYDEKKTGTFVDILQRDKERETLKQAWERIEMQTSSNMCIKNKQDLALYCKRFGIEFESIDFNVEQDTIYVKTNKEYSQEYLNAIQDYCSHYSLLGMNVHFIAWR